MKNKLFYIIQTGIILLVASVFYGCNDTIEQVSDDRMKGVSIVPNPMTVGEMVCISGPDFKNATAIVFPGGVSVTDFTITGDFQLNAVVPSGVEREGNITVSLPGSELVIPFLVTIYSTGSIKAESKDVDKETGYYRVGPNDEIIIRGEGLGAITEAILPGGASVECLNFDKKTETTIVFTIPMGGFDNKAVEPLKLIGRNGEEFYTANLIDWSGEGYIPPELLPFCGRTFKVWGWDEEVKSQFGNGEFSADIAPNWWTLSADDENQFGNDALGAKMAFMLPNKLVKTYVDGTVAEGKFAIEILNSPIRNKWYAAEYGDIWSSEKMIITRGDDNFSIVGGTNRESMWGGYPKEFFVVKITNSEMVLAVQRPNEPSTADFFMFRVREDEGEGSGGGGTVTVPDEYKPFAGEGSKTWEWNDADGNCYGKGDGIQEDNPTWWAAPKGGKEFVAGEGMGATMTLTYGGKGNLKLTKNKYQSDDTETGSWDIDMTARKAGWNRAIGKFTTDKITVLSGIDDGGNDVFEYWILKMTDTEMMLGKSEEGDDWDFGKEGWGTATMWLFRVQE